MQLSTRSFSLVRVVVLTASLFVAASDARAQSQFVTVRFQTRITGVGGNFSGRVAVGDVITGFFVYDLTKSSPDPDLRNPPTTYYDALVCTGFSTGGVIVTGRADDTPPTGVVEISNNVPISGGAQDGFAMNLIQGNGDSLDLYQPQIAQFYLEIFTNSSDPNPSVLTSDLLQVVPTVGWDLLNFFWSDQGVYNANIQAGFGQPFQISVEVGEVGGPSPCAVIGAARRDFDGDQKADLVVFRPTWGSWYIRTSSPQYPPDSHVYQWGLPGDMPMSGDFDGDGKADLVVWRPSNGSWYIRYSSLGYSLATVSEVQWGLPGDIPISGDFDGDGKNDLAVWRPSNGYWYIRYSSLGYSLSIVDIYQWGLPGDIPISADFDGDGKTDLVVWRPSNGTWYIRYSSLGYSLANAAQYQWGLPGDVPVSGDFDGDGKTDLVVFRPSIGGWFLRRSSAGYSINSFAYYQWGLLGDQPLALDFDGDGVSDLVVYRPETGEWFVLFSLQGFNPAKYGWAQWGLPGDLIPR